jgi:leucyl aminopeptidase
LGPEEKVTTEKLRRSYAALTEFSIKKKIPDLNLVLPKISGLDEEASLRGVVEGLLLANYTFDQLKHDSIKEEKTELLKKVHLIGGGKNTLAYAQKCLTICDGVYLARDLINGNADDVNPDHLVQVAKGFAKTLSHVKTTVFGRKEIEKEKMGLLLAVSRGSARDPAFIICEYKGNPKSKDHTVLVGKGVTYDTGGLNLKPTGSMEEMKCDMSGAAVALATLYTAANLGLKVNLTAVVPACENGIDASSYKPGDVYKSYSGKTVEIGNTDAEGRLILADALAFANDHLKPTRLIDFATLTGAMVIALGHETTGLMSNDDSIAKSLIQAGNETFERVWRLPLFEEYKDQLKSDIADIRNIGGRPAGSITAALFLQEFVGKTPWAHLDIAGTAHTNEKRRYHLKQGSGIGVRLMIEFLENLAAK